MMSQEYAGRGCLIPVCSVVGSTWGARGQWEWLRVPWNDGGQRQGHSGRAPEAVDFFSAEPSGKALARAPLSFLPSMPAYEAYALRPPQCRAWRQGTERPFLLDNVWDLQRLLDYLATRPDADMARVGMTGVSLGGMHTWLCAAADERVAVAAPMIGLQCFK